MFLRAGDAVKEQDFYERDAGDERIIFVHPQFPDPRRSGELLVDHFSGRIMSVEQFRMAVST